MHRRFKEEVSGREIFEVEKTDAFEDLRGARFAQSPVPGCTDLVIHVKEQMLGPFGGPAETVCISLDREEAKALMKFLMYNFD